MKLKSPDSVNTVALWLDASFRPLNGPRRAGLESLGLCEEVGN
jgi:hypothetical protein